MARLNNLYWLQRLYIHHLHLKDLYLGQDDYKISRVVMNKTHIVELTLILKTYMQYYVKVS